MKARLVLFIAVLIPALFVVFSTKSYPWCIAAAEINENNKCGVDRMTLCLWAQEFGLRCHDYCIELEDIPHIRKYLDSTGNPLIDLPGRCRPEKLDPPEIIIKIDKAVEKEREKLRNIKGRSIYASEF
jgi:hypothetical protein